MTTPAPRLSGNPDLRHPVDVRTSRVHGRGVFSVGPMPARRKIGELTGCLVDLPRARHAIENTPTIYFIELTTRVALDCSEGNDLKHLNHSCHPNCYLRVVGHRVEVYTRREIGEGEELFVDYGQTPHAGGMACACGTPGCRNRL